MHISWFYLQLCVVIRTLPYRGHNRDVDTRYVWMRCSWSDKHWTHTGHSTYRWNRNEKAHIKTHKTTIICGTTADDTIIKFHTNWCKIKFVWWSTTQNRRYVRGQMKVLKSGRYLQLHMYVLIRSSTNWHEIHCSLNIWPNAYHGWKLKKKIFF